MTYLPPPGPAPNRCLDTVSRPARGRCSARELDRRAAADHRRDDSRSWLIVRAGRVVELFVRGRARTPAVANRAPWWARGGVRGRIRAVLVARVFARGYVVMFGMAESAWERGTATFADGFAAFRARAGAALVAWLGLVGARFRRADPVDSDARPLDARVRRRHDVRDAGGRQRRGAAVSSRSAESLQLCAATFVPFGIDFACWWRSSTGSAFAGYCRSSDHGLVQRSLPMPRGFRPCRTAAGPAARRRRGALPRHLRSRCARRTMGSTRSCWSACTGRLRRARGMPSFRRPRRSVPAGRASAPQDGRAGRRSRAGAANRPSTRRQQPGRCARRSESTRSGPTCPRSG